MKCQNSTFFNFTVQNNIKFVQIWQVFYLLSQLQGVWAFHRDVHADDDDV